MGPADRPSQPTTSQTQVRPGRRDASAAGSVKPIASSDPEIPGVLIIEQSQITFAAPSSRVSVFFDECNQEVISLTSGIDAKTKVVFQTADNSERLVFLIPVEKRVLSIKLNPGRTILAYHVEKSIVEFSNLERTQNSNGSVSCSLESKRYVQASRTKNSKLFGFLWTGPSELVMVTDISIEYYHVEPQRRRLRHVKSFLSSTNWFVYQPTEQPSAAEEEVTEPFSVLMVSTGSLGNSMQPYLFTRGQMIKLQRFEVEGNWEGRDKLELFERSITIASIYGKVRLLVLQHESLNVRSRGAQILMYTVDHESGTTNKTHTLDLDVNGKFAINIVDNLVVAHDQPSRTSFIFDIMIESTEKSDCPRHYVGLIDGQSLRASSKEDQPKKLDMYSLNWVFFQPNFIINAKIGSLFTLHLDLEVFQSAIQENLMLLNFLALRRNSSRIILRKCRDIVGKARDAIEAPRATGSSLAEVSSSFDVLGRLVASAPELKKNMVIDETGPRASVISPGNIEPVCYNTVIPQEDVHREVFQQLESGLSQSPSHMHFVTSTLLEFIFFVRNQGKSVDFCIYEQLIRCLVRGKRYYQLVQMIRSEILKDSKQLACLLLSLREEYKPAVQLGLDMLQRLDCLGELMESLSLCPDSNMAGEATDRLSDALSQSIEVDAR